MGFVLSLSKLAQLARSLTKIVRSVCNQFPFSASNCYKLYFDQMHNNKDMYLHRELFVYIMWTE